MENYYLGLDMGTNSVGWAVTDMQYNLIRKKGKDLWGIREFNEAKGTVDRRINRTGRRRRQREQVRQGLLKSYFANEIEKVDPFFFVRIDNSKFHLDDKAESVRNKYAIFNDSDYTDVDYYKDYPTIFHLRKELIENEDAHDVRLVYLAIANMFKHRGHFLNDSISTKDIPSMQVIYDRFRELISENSDEGDESLSFISVSADKIEEILSDKSISRSEKSEKLRELLNVDRKNKKANEYIRCICGLKVDGKKLFSSIETEEKTDICFGDFGYEEKIPDIISALGEDNYEILELMKQMYDIGILSGILKGSDYLSFSRCKEYDKHKKDLVILKKVIRKYKSAEQYDYIFRSDEPGTYSSYVNSNLANGLKQRRNYKNRKADDLYGSINKLLKDINDDPEVDYILSEIKNENFLPKQLTSANGVIPNQVHKKELEKILSNAEAYLPFLKEVDESGLSVSERIISLFSFHVPFYIGPVTEQSKKNNGNGWVVRREQGPVMPWNYKQKIDIGKTSEEFILRMVRDCTYLRGEKVLPKSSLMYEAYCVLNEINNIKIDGEKLDVTVKQDIYNELFKKGKKVTKKQLADFLALRGLIDNSEQLSGIDNTINNALSTYGKFFAIFGKEMDNDSTQEMVEKIVFFATVFGESKSLFKARLIEDFGDILDEAKIKRILGYKFKDWGRLSKDFLELQGTSYESGERLSLIRAMWETNFNLMELINSDEFSFAEELESRRNEATKELGVMNYEDLDDFYFSAPVKRMVWQTLLVVNEVKEIMGNEPEKIFIEMTRSDEEKGDSGRKDSRKKQLLELYKNINDNLQDWKTLIEDSDASGKLKSKKMYLYLTQMGRDMYTGKPIDLDKLFNDNIYDIDHIYPRSLVKDDSLNNNLVLVYKPINNDKSNVYPLDESIVSNKEVRDLWSTLHEKKLINDEKYSRLTSRNPFTEEELAGFIARQLVETSQATKGVADILKSLCPSARIVYSKAKNVSDFRNDHDLLKTRLLNEFHHANDAYLNIVVGNVYDVKFTNNPINYIKKEYRLDSKKYAYHMGKMFEKDIMRGEYFGWKAGDNGTISTVKKVMSKNSPLLSRMVLEGSGELYNLQPKSHSEAKAANYVPLKSSIKCMGDVCKYGGYGSLKPAYFTFIEYGNAGRRKRIFECVPMIFKDKYHTDKELLEYYEKNGYENVKIIIPKIKKDSLLRIDGYDVYLVGMDSRKYIELHNAVNITFNNNEFKAANYIHDIEKSYGKDIIHENINLEDNLRLYRMIMEKYSEGIMSKYPKDIYSMLKNGEDKFNELSINKQVNVLYNILTISSINGKVTELKDIGGPSSDVGRIRISGNMTGRTEVKLIQKSITGVYEKTIDLLQL